eukprot:739324-Pleurochrysis_carterae.AAC.1
MHARTRTGGAMAEEQLCAPSRLVSRTSKEEQLLVRKCLARRAAVSICVCMHECVSMLTCVCVAVLPVRVRACVTACGCVCAVAVIGGLFAVFGMIDGIIFRTGEMMGKKII